MEISWIYTTRKLNNNNKKKEFMIYHYFGDVGSLLSYKLQLALKR